MSTAVTGTILIVEDDTGVARLQQRRLERAGFRVICATTPEEALQVLREGQVDLLVLDYRLPGGQTGIAFYEQLKAAGHDLPVIMVTGFSDEAMVIKALRVGVRDFVTKSAEYLDYLPEAVARVLRQVQTEKQLRLMDAAVRQSYDSILITTVDLDLPGPRIVFVNPAFTRLTGYEAAEVIGQTPRILQGPKTDRATLDRLRQSLSQGKRFEGETVNYRKDGTEFRMEWNVVPLRNDRGAIINFVAVQRDNSERRKAESQLREQAALLSKAQDAILVRDMDDQIIFWNAGAERMYGWSSAEALGRNANELFYSKRPVPDSAEAQRAVLQTGEWIGELHQDTRDGKDVIVESRWTLVRDDAGKPKQKLIINTDITLKKQLEAQARRAQRMESIGTLAGGIAHDLNNVLTPILMAVELLQTKISDPTSQSLLATVQGCVKRGTNLIQQVLSFARGSEGLAQPLQLYHLLAEVGQLLRQTLPKAIDVQVSAPKDLWLISADPTHIHQVIMNLCVNARDAMPGGGRLAIDAKNTRLEAKELRLKPDARIGPYVVVTVEDTGTGIPADVLDKIFDPFFTTKEVGKGTGLGLSTVAGIVRSYGGFVNVYSTVGKGTRFSVYLSASQSEEAKRAEQQQQPLPGGSGELILVVDDEESIREIAKATLESWGYRVGTAANGAEALAVYAQHRGDVRLVLTDMMMPVMDGPSVIRALRQLDPGVRVIAASGLKEMTRAEKGNLGEHAFLQKPFTAEAMLTAVRKALVAR